MVGFSRNKPIAQGLHGSAFFQDSDFVILAADPRFLILRIKTCAFKAVLIAAHAPHAGASLDDIQSFWHRLSDVIPSKYNDWPRILLADANARVGSITSVHNWPTTSRVGRGKIRAIFATFLLKKLFGCRQLLMSFR